MIPKYPVSVKAVMEKGGKFFMLIKEVDGRIEFSFPGGLVEKGESLEEALKREVREETGLEVEPLRVFHATKYRHPRGGEDIGIYYVVKVVGGRIRLGGEKDQKFLQAKFLSEEEMPSWARTIVQIYKRFKGKAGE